MNRLTYLSLLALPLAIACGKDKTAADDSGVVGTTDKCTVEVSGTSPADGSATAYFKDQIDFKLTEPDATATITTDIPGSQMVSADGLTISWVPSPVLAPLTDYSATLDYCGGSVPLSFKTSELGGAMTDTSILQDRTYILDLGTANIVEPPGVGAVLGSLVETGNLIHVGTVSASSIGMSGGLQSADTGGQDYCTATFPFPEADFSAAPYFAVGPQDTALSFAGYNINVKQLEITGTFAPDGSYFGGGTLGGSVDARDIATAFPELGYDAAGLCSFLVSFGAQCEACTDDSEPYCLTLVANQIVAEEASGVDFVEIAANDCADCASGPPDPLTCVAE